MTKNLFSLTQGLLVILVLLELPVDKKGLLLCQIIGAKEKIMQLVCLGVLKIIVVKAVRVVQILILAKA